MKNRNAIAVLFVLSAVPAFAALPTKFVLPDPARLEINKERTIQFQYPLPRMRCGDVKCGTYNNAELSLPGVLTTSDSRLGMFVQRLRETIMANRRLVFVDGRVLMCNHNWIRDHVHQMKGWRHWEYDPLSFLQFIIDTQRADGQFFELVKQMDDCHWAMVGPESHRLYPEDNMSLVRLDLEADVEYLVVEGAWQYYRMTGDDKWLASVLPALEKGIDYQTSDPVRWEGSLGLCIRPYTIDTWDFTNDPASGGDRRIAGKPLCAMHGDNTGVYQAMKQLAWMNRRLGNKVKAAAWDARAARLRESTMKHLWNGKFFVHQLPVRGAKSLDENEARRLSLSDAYALNRGILTGDECRAVIDSFIERGRTAGTFAEWFTIDPAYEPLFQGYKPGEYVNGAISPFTAGELAKGAFENGREKYAWSVISRWMEMLEKDKAIYFLYNRKTGESISEGAGPSAWGAAALMDAVDEGLAGIRDIDGLYRRIRFAPRWAVTPYKEGRYVTGYEISRALVDVRWIFTDMGFRYRLASPAEEVVAHLMVPDGKVPVRLLVNGRETPFAKDDVCGSLYLDATVRPESGIADFEVVYENDRDIAEAADRLRPGESVFMSKAPVVFPGIFGDHAVVQRDSRSSVWGRAPAGDCVTVTLGGAEAKAVAGSDGWFLARIDTGSLGEGPFDLVASSPSGKAVSHDVLVGEVWLAAGQSNMELRMKSQFGAIFGYEERERLCSDRPIRIFREKRSRNPEPIKGDARGEWMCVTPETLPNLTAVGYCFIDTVQRRIGGPAGVVDISWSGTRCWGWMPRECIDAHPELTAERIAQESYIANDDPGAVKKPVSICWNNMFAPLEKLACRGIIWYQGCCDSSMVDAERLYPMWMSYMVAEMRRAMERPNLPFLYVQLAGWGDAPDVPGCDKPRAHLREAQRLARRMIPNAHMAVSLDQSEKEIHNRGKSVVGDRLAALALNRVYGKKDIVCFSPEYASAEFKDGAAFVRFETEGSPLKAGAIRESYPWDAKHVDEIPLPRRSSPKSELEGFVIRGADGEWHWADGWIVSDDTVRVSADGVSEPTAVRYAWGGQGFGNLVNAAGLPAVPFTTDGGEMSKPIGDRK